MRAKPVKRRGKRLEFNLIALQRAIDTDTLTDEDRALYVATFGEEALQKRMGVELPPARAYNREMSKQ